jgi:hypothetical protein
LERRVWRVVRCWTASAKVPEAGGEGVEVLVEARTWGGRRERQRLKSGLGKTVRALTRMLVVVSSRVRCGLNWYLILVVSGFANEKKLLL